MFQSEPINHLEVHSDASSLTLQAKVDNHTRLSKHLMTGPSTIAPSLFTSERIIQTIQSHPRSRWITILTNWCGEYSSQDARKCFSEASIPTYRTPEGAITAYMHMVEYRRNQKQLTETPALPIGLTANTTKAHALIQKALKKGITQLDTHEVEPILRAYGLKILPTWIAHNSDQAITIAEKIGYPVALKSRSADIPHKSDIQGVMLYLRNAKEVADASQGIFDRAAQHFPNAMIQGLLVQSMANKAGALELKIAIEQDPIFGPLILLGDGYIERQPETHAAVTIPPLNMTLARYLVIQAIKNHKIKSTNSSHQLNIDGLCQLLVRVSNLLIDCPQIVRLNIHPLLACDEEFTLHEFHTGI